MSNAKILITGGAGLLGQHLIKYALPDATITATQRTTPVNNASAITVDLTDPHAVQRAFAEVQPDLVIHTAYTLNSESDIVDATKNVVEACRATGANLLYLSTDALFDGRHAPYTETDAPTPITEYGRWKARAELYVVEHLPLATVIRTSLITQFNPLDPRSAWVANSLRKQEPITLFVDELRCPILVEDLARQIWEIAMIPPPKRGGMWHLVGPEAISRYTLGLLIAQYERLDATGIASAYTDALKRPRDLRLLTTRADALLPTRARAMSTALMDTRHAG